METQEHGDASELLREVLETRNQMIKTTNTVTVLSGEIRELARIQQRLERGRTVNSIATYAIFLGLVALGFYFTQRARLDHAALEKDVLMRQHTVLVNRLRETEQKLKKNRKTAAKAYEFYTLLRTGKILQAIERYPEVDRLPLTKVEAAVFSDQVNRNRNQLAYRAYSAGVRAVGEKNWARAAAELRRSLGLLPEPPYAAPLHFHLGLALTRLGSYTEAAQTMERAIAADAEKLVSREIRYHLATVYEQLGQRTKARTAYQKYARNNPNGRLARSARRRVKALMEFAQ